MRSSFGVSIALCALSGAVAVGCTTSGVRDLPDVVIMLDGGGFDTGTDAGFPDPTIDTCEEPGHTIGETCADSDACSDGCFCNGNEVCTGGVCAAGVDPCLEMPADVECTDEACLEETNLCFHMPNHSICSNSLACDGYEQCDRMRGCVPAAPLYCNDESSCTVDSCDDSMGCVYTPRDLDGDGFLAGSCGGDDCDDDPRYGTMIFPGAPEVCDNRRDDDCDGRRDFSDSECVPMNNTCETATMLPARTGTYSGSTAGLTANYTLGCIAGTGPDAVFRFTLTEAHDVRVAVSGIANPAVALRAFASCAAGPDLKCSSGAAPSVLARSLPPGDYAIIVRTNTGGPFDLSLMISDPTPIPAIDTCNASTVVISASGEYRGRFEETNDDYRLSCHPTGSWRDAAYRLVLAADSDVVLTGTTTGAAFSTTYVSLLTDCADPLTTMSCQQGTSAEVRRRTLPAGTYYVLLESSDAAAPEWSLRVTITTPPAARQVGDACSTAVPIPLTPGAGGIETGTAMTMLTGAELDGGTTCGGSTTGNRDVFFSFDLTATRDITLTTQTAFSVHFVAVETMCGVPASEVRCRNSSSTAPYSQVFRSLPAGRYYVVLATSAASGNATATLETRAPTPIPPNDLCAGAIVLTNGDSFRHTLIGFEDDLAGCSGSSLLDAFYTFTLATPRRVIISASIPGGGTQRIYLTLRNTCAAGPALTGGCVNSAGTATINTGASALPAGTYSLQVEMSAVESTDFNIDFVTLSP